MTIPSPITIAEAAADWLTKCERDRLEEWTLRSYRSHVNVHLIPRIGDQLVVELTRKSVRRFVDDMLATMSHSQTKKVLNTLKGVLNHMVDEEIIEDNVAQTVRVRHAARHQKERVIPTKEQIRLLIHHAPLRHHALIVTALITGLRMCELRGLRWKNVDFQQKLIQVRERVDEKGCFGPPKSRAGRRDISMAPMVLEALSDWRTRCPESELDLVFPNGAGKPESHANISNRVFRPLMKDCGLVHDDGKLFFTMHDMRHAAASMLIDAGFNPKQVQTILGHSAIAMTFDTYGHLFEDRERDAEMMAAMQEKLMAA